MSEQGLGVLGGMRGTIRSRLLLNALVDPEEAARRLPAGLRPHVVGDSTVVGCCLLDIAAVRPAGLPAAAGLSLRAAAHRISVEWDDELGSTAVGVYVPLRLTGSRAAIALGGRLFPGVHGRAQVGLTHDGRRFSWTVEPDRGPGAYRVRVDASARGGGLSPCEPIGATCLGAETGLSPGHDGEIEAARMTTHRRDACLVEVHHLDSAFLAGFKSAKTAPCYLMRDVDVTWARAPVPRARPSAPVA